MSIHLIMTIFTAKCKINITCVSTGKKRHSKPEKLHRCVNAFFQLLNTCAGLAGRQGRLAAAANMKLCAASSLNTVINGHGWDLSR